MLGRRGEDALIDIYLSRQPEYEKLELGQKGK